MKNDKINKTSWSSDGNTFPHIEPHTKEKHVILESYLKDWAITLCANHAGNSSVLTIVDAFCGGGFYHDPDTNSIWNGSPIRILESIEYALKYVKEKRGKPRFKLNIKIYFIDSNKEHTKCLENYLKIIQYDKKYADFNFEIITNEFSLTLDKIIESIKKRGGSSFF